MAADNPLIKKAFTQQKVTKKQYAEYEKCENDPHYFLNNYYYIQTVKGTEQYKAYEYQERLIDSYHNYRFSLNLLSRQSGKCLIGNEKISVKRKNSDEIFSLPIKIFYEWSKDNSIDISQYKI